MECIYITLSSTFTVGKNHFTPALLMFPNIQEAIGVYCQEKA